MAKIGHTGCAQEVLWTTKDSETQTTVFRASASNVCRVGRVIWSDILLITDFDWFHIALASILETKTIWSISRLPFDRIFYNFVN